MKYLKYALLFACCTLSAVADRAEADTLIAQTLIAQTREALGAKENKLAVDLAKQATAAAPDYAEAFSTLGTAYAMRIGEVNFMAQAMMSSQMLSAYQKSVELDPNHIGGYIGLARFYSNAPAIAGGSLDKAEDYAREVEKRVGWLGANELALIAEKRGDNVSAAELFRTALAGNPNYGEAQAGLARVTTKADAE